MISIVFRVCAATILIVGEKADMVIAGGRLGDGQQAQGGGRQA